jgi:hypothetical protein
LKGYNSPLFTCCASTNNGNESIHAVVKKEDTLRELLNLNIFIHVAIRMVRKWSYNVNPDNVNRHLFNSIPALYTNPNIILPVWTKAYNWKQSTEIFHFKFKSLYYVRASENTNAVINDDFIENYERLMLSLKFKPFNHCIPTSLGLWCIEIDHITPSNSSCTCPKFYKKYICRHALGILIRLKVLDCPLKAKNVPIGYTRGVGRPKNRNMPWYSSLIFSRSSLKTVVMMKIGILKLTTH